MALNASPTANLNMNNVRIPSIHRIGEEGDGFSIALSSLDVGRLGISACAVGQAQSGFDIANSYSQDRLAFGQSIADFQGIAFMLADMVTKIHASRCVYIDAAALLDSGESISLEASISKLLSTDTAMAVTTDAVQVLGGNGFTTDYRVERLMREAKVLQIVEGTNQIQRVVIARELRK
jgi:alkylation response protein AidB-like acyl-CoA dehydrogenase